MNRCAIIIHSVFGNTFIIGSYLKELLVERNVDARLYRVEDPDHHIWANQSDMVNEYYEDIQSLPIAGNEILLKSAMVLLGSPTTFGNVSAEMKFFMDATRELSESQALVGKFFGCFTSCDHSISEGSFCLDSMIHYAQAMGMVHIPYGTHMDHLGASQPVSGIVHLAGRENAIRPSQELGDALAVYADTLARYLQ